MADILSGLFGVDPAQYQQQQAIAQSNQNMQLAQLDPMQSARYSLMQGGSQLGNIGTQLFGAQDPMLKKASDLKQIASQFDTTTPEGLIGMAKAAIDAGYVQEGQRAVAVAQDMRVKQATIEQKTREKIPVIGEQVNQALYADAFRRANGDSIKAAQIYDAEEQAKKQRVAAASATPAPGSVPLDVLKQGRSIVKDYTGDAGQTLKDIKVIVATGNALKTNSTLLPQFQTQIAQFTRDKQIGYKQIQNALGSAGIGSDVVEGFNKFIEGKPTNIKIDDVLRGVKALEKVYGQEYNRGIENARTLLTQGKITEETQKALLPPPYKFPVAPPKVGEIRSGYRFKGGDPSQKENYEAVR